MALPMHKKTAAPKYTIAVASGKGGVGKSTVAVNLALALRGLGFSVGIMDTDIYGPSIRRMLPEDRMPTQSGETLIPALSKGIKVISMAYFRKEDEAAVIRAPIANGIITQFVRQVNWGDLDYLIIDFPPGTGDVQLTLSQQANLSGAIMVTTPQEIALMDVRKAVNLFEQVKVPIIGVIENMSGLLGTGIYPFGKGGGEKLALESGVPFLGTIPIDPELCEKADCGETSSNSTPVFHSIAQKVTEHLQSENAVKFAISKMYQKDEHSFTIEWLDGKVTETTFSKLQKSCPCAGCQEGNVNIQEKVGANQITTVGRYALRIDFTTGCSNGIYDFEILRAT